MKLKRFRPFLAPDGIPSAVGFMPAVGEPAADDTPADLIPGEPTPDAPDDEPTPTPEGEPTPTAPAKPPTAFVDASDLAKQFGEIIGQHIKAPAKTEEKPLTPEEARKLLNVWEPSDEWLAKYDNLETRKAAIAEMRDALVRQSDTVAQMRLNEMRQQIELQYNPVREMLQQQAQEQRMARFASDFPLLAKPELAPLIQAVGQQLQAQGKTFTDEKSMFTELANGVEKVIQVTNPGFKLTKPSATPRQGKVPVTSPGSGGVSGGGEPAEGPKVSRAVSLLPKVR